MHQRRGAVRGCELWRRHDPTAPSTSCWSLQGRIMSAKSPARTKCATFTPRILPLLPRASATRCPTRGLTNELPAGPAALELNQGDGKSGRLSREDVAALA